MDHGRANGVTLNFAESIETVQANLREIQPTLFFAVPRIWEKIHATVLIKLQDATRFKRRSSSIGLKLADVIGKERIANGGDHTFKSRAAYFDRQPPLLPVAQGTHRAAALPVGGFRGGCHRPRGARVLHGPRRPRL